jgi:hypothetical protein
MERVDPAADVFWLRPDPIRRLSRPFWAAGAVFVAGGLLGYWGYNRSGGGVAGHAAIGGGLVLIAAAVGTVFYVALRLLADETCLAIRRDGLMYQRGRAPERFVPWSRLGAARVEGDEVVADVDRGPALRIAATELDWTPFEMARLVDDARRKAQLGLPFRR